MRCLLWFRHLATSNGLCMLLHVPNQIQSLNNLSFHLPHHFPLEACVCLCVWVCMPAHPRACLCDNSSTVQARIAKLGPLVQSELVKAPIFLGGNRPWPSRLNLTRKSKITSLWACPYETSPKFESLNLNHKYISVRLRNLLVSGLITLEFQFNS